MFYVLYFTFITYLLAATMPESQGRWSSLYNDTLSLICYIRLATSTALLQYRFAAVTNPLLAGNSLSPVGGVDVCLVSFFGINSTCHPLDVPTTPTPTLVLNTPVTRTVSAIAASPILYDPVPYKDMFPTQPEIKIGLRKSQGSESKQGGIRSNVEPTRPSDFLSTATSTMIVLQLLMVREAFFDSLLPG